VRTNGPQQPHQDGECHTAVVRITPACPRTGNAAGEDAFGLVAWGEDDDAILRCTSTLEELRAVVGDLSNAGARYELAYALDPCIGAPWSVSPGAPQKGKWEGRLAELSQRFEPHRETLMRAVEEGYAAEPAAHLVRIVKLDAETGSELDVNYGAWARGRFATAITLSASSLEEMTKLVGGDLADERALWQLVQGTACQVGTYDGGIVNPLLAWLGTDKR